MNEEFKYLKFTEITFCDKKREDLTIDELRKVIEVLYNDLELVRQEKYKYQRLQF